MKKSKTGEKRSNRTRKIILKLLFLILVIYVSMTLVNQQMMLSEKREELKRVEEQLKVQELRNAEVRNILSSDVNDNADYIERVAREELNLIGPGERVFENILGN